MASTKPICGVADSSGISPIYSVKASDFIICPCTSDSLGRVRFYSTTQTAGSQPDCLKLFFIQGLASPLVSNLALSPNVMRSENTALASAMADLRASLVEAEEGLVLKLRLIYLKI